MSRRFVHAMQVRFADTDAQGHMYFANYLTFCDEALAAYMRHIGYPWQALVEDGLDMFYRAARCEYRGSAKFEMQLAIETRISPHRQQQRRVRARRARTGRRGHRGGGAHERVRRSRDTEPRGRPRAPAARGGELRGRGLILTPPRRHPLVCCAPGGDDAWRPRTSARAAETGA
ncbi:MAG: acyl-CoA thioesterase [Sandaracinaceae bacterium]|nr:acyl-CoA thioesterase [Sandaracinaceae bacterium]